MPPRAANARKPFTRNERFRGHGPLRPQRDPFVRRVVNPPPCRRGPCPRGRRMQGNRSPGTNAFAGMARSYNSVAHGSGGWRIHRPCRRGPCPRGRRMQGNRSPGTIAFAAMGRSYNSLAHSNSCALGSDPRNHLIYLTSHSTESCFSRLDGRFRQPFRRLRGSDPGVAGIGHEGPWGRLSLRHDPPRAFGRTPWRRPLPFADRTRAGAVRWGRTRATT
jgi:hypothetical protein